MAKNLDEKWRFYGRRSGRRLGKGRQGLLNDLYPRIKISEDIIDEKGSLDPSSLFSFKPEKIIFEIGFGSGEHLAEMMRRAPENGFIGAEAFINGAASFLKTIDEQETTQNIRLLIDDAIPLVKSLKQASIDELYILNPDPWHKTRHHSRRIVNPDNLTLFSRILKPKGKLILSTDVRDLVEWMVTHTVNHPDFHWTANSSDDWRTPPPDWIPTRYETKGAKGADKMNYLFFERV